MPAAGKKGLGGKCLKAVDNVLLAWVKKLLPWQCAALERHECWAPARAALGRWIQHVWNEGNVRLHTKANAYNTVVTALLSAWKDRTIYSCHGKWSAQSFSQCLWVLAGKEGHDEISTTEIPECCQIFLCSSENLGMCQLTANSKPSLLAHWHHRVERLKKFYQPLLKADLSCGAQCWQFWLGQKNILSCPRLKVMITVQYEQAIRWNKSRKADVGQK